MYVPPAFSMPMGLSPFVPVFQHGLMHGSEDVREMSATALGELAQYSSADALKPHLVKITGPLIRIVGDKFQPKVRVLPHHSLRGYLFPWVCTYVCVCVF